MIVDSALIPAPEILMLPTQMSRKADTTQYNYNPKIK